MTFHKTLSQGLSKFRGKTEVPKKEARETKDTYTINNVTVHTQKEGDYVALLQLFCPTHKVVQHTHFQRAS